MIQDRGKFGSIRSFFARVGTNLGVIGVTLGASNSGHKWGGSGRFRVNSDLFRVIRVGLGIDRVIKNGSFRPIYFIINMGFIRLNICYTTLLIHSSYWNKKSITLGV
jgi:hypothetical protein